MPEKKTQRTTLLLDPEIHRRVKILAAEQGTTFTDLVTRALQEFLEREGKRRKGRS